MKKITFTRKTADVLTANGRIRTKRVIVTTGMPTPLYKSLARHFWFRTTYFAQTEPVPAKIRQQMGRRDAVLRDSAESAASDSLGRRRSPAGGGRRRRRSAGRDCATRSSSSGPVS